MSHRPKLVGRCAVSFGSFVQILRILQNSSGKFEVPNETNLILFRSWQQSNLNTLPLVQYPPTAGEQEAGLRGNVTRGYLRLRILVALLTVLVVAIVSHQISRASHRNVVAKASIVDAIDRSTAAIVESQSNIMDIRNAREESVAGAARTRIKKTLPELQSAIEMLQTALSENTVSDGTRNLLEDDFLDVLGNLQDFQLITLAVLKNDSAFGARSERFNKATRSSVGQLMPLMAELKTFEIEDLEKANSRLASLGDLMLTAMVFILVLIGLLVFLPMERSVLQAQADARRKQRQAEAASESKSNFLAAMSHEIRTPMNGVLGMSELLMETELGSEQRRMVEIVNSSGRSLLSIIDDVLDFSKVEAGKMNLDYRPFKPASHLGNLTELLRPTAEKTGVMLSLVIDPGIANCLVGDEGRFGQILTNLVGNAVKFSENGKVTVTAKVEKETDKHQTLIFSVEDTGIGMTDEQLDRIFNKFEQADNSTTRKFGGTGLGLAISAGLTEAMGGRIWAESTFGQGSTFFVCMEFEVHDVQETGSVVTLAAQKQKDFSGLNVLVAEDNKVNQLVIRKMLKSLKCNVSIAINGAEAVKQFKLDRPDIVLMDISMPVMNGYDAAREIRLYEAQRDMEPTPMVALSAHIDADHNQKCFDAGMTMVMAKPVSIEKLGDAFDTSSVPGRPVTSPPETKERIAQ